MKFRVLSRSQLESWERAHAGRALGARRTGKLGTPYGAKFHFAKFNKRLGRIVRLRFSLMTLGVGGINTLNPVSLLPT